MRPWLILLVVGGLPGCGGGPAEPVAIDTANDVCAHCRMVVSDPRVAAQIVAPDDEPLIFDDIGCLRDYLASHDAAMDAGIFVADHRTGAWIPATSAVFTRSTVTRTPMASGILAHADGGSRDGDPAAARAEHVPVDAILGGRQAAGAGR